MEQFLGALRKLITVDAMLDEHRGELLGLVNHLDAAAEVADRVVLQRNWRRA